MASFRGLVHLSPFNRRLVLKGPCLTKMPRHKLKSNISSYCFTRRSKCLPSLNSQRLNRFLHDDKESLDSKMSSAKLHEGKEVKNDPVPGAQGEKQLTQVQRLRKIFAEYGSTAVAFHVTISLTSLGICYTAVKSGIDVPSMLQKIGISKDTTDSAVTTGASTFVIAYACHKVFAPVRMFLTITCTPLIVKRLRFMGILKPPPAQTK